MNNLQNEVWKDALGWEGFYQVSNLGRVKSLSRAFAWSQATLDNRIQPDKIKEIKALYKTGEYYQHNLAKMYNISQAQVNRLIKGTRGILEKAKNKERILKQFVSRDGYCLVKLSVGKNRTKTLSVHRLVLSAFLPNLDNLPQVNHLDGNKQNNKLENLEWTTNQLNAIHALSLGLSKPRVGEQNSQSILKAIQVCIILYFKSKFPNSILARFFSLEFSVDKATISDILTGRGWKHIVKTDFLIDDPQIVLFTQKICKLQNELDNKWNHKFPKETMARIQNQYLTGDYSTRDLAKIYNTNHSTIQACLKLVQI